MPDSVHATSAAPQYNLMRQKLGAKGAATRQRILDSAVRLVNVQTGEVPTISMICRAALVSKATFYQYFEDLGALVTELLDPVALDVDRLGAIMAENWPEGERFERSYAFIAAYLDHWDRYRVPLRLRNYLADTGDKAMIYARLRSMDPIIRTLALKLRDARGDGRERRDDYALAIALMHAIMNAAIYVTHNVYPAAIDEAVLEIHGDPGDYQHRALAHLLATALQNAEVPR